LRFCNNDIGAMVGATLIRQFEFFSVKIALLPSGMKQSAAKRFLVSTLRSSYRRAPSFCRALGRAINIAAITRPAQLYLATAQSTKEQPVTVIFQSSGARTTGQELPNLGHFRWLWHGVSARCLSSGDSSLFRVPTVLHSVHSLKFFWQKQLTSGRA
jgi:hypothetical protein